MSTFQCRYLFTYVSFSSQSTVCISLGSHNEESKRFPHNSFFSFPPQSASFLLMSFLLSPLPSIGFFDPQGPPKVTPGSDFNTCHLYLLTFTNKAKQTNFQLDIMWLLHWQCGSLMTLILFFIFSSHHPSTLSFDPRGRLQSRPIVITIFTQIVRQCPYVT